MSERTAQADLALAREHLQQNDVRLVIVCNRTIAHEDRRSGLLPLAEVLAYQSHLLAGAAVADRVIGRAGAMCLIAGRVAAAYTPLTSTPARSLLARAGMIIEADAVVDHIANRAGTGLCPMESLVADSPDPDRGVQAILRFFSLQP